QKGGDRVAPTVVPESAIPRSGPAERASVNAPNVPGRPNSRPAPPPEPGGEFGGEFVPYDLRFAIPWMNPVPSGTGRAASRTPPCAPAPEELRHEVRQIAVARAHPARHGDCPDSPARSRRGGRRRRAALLGTLPLVRPRCHAPGRPDCRRERGREAGPDPAPAIEFAWRTGWRIGEIRKLTWTKHVDFRAGVIRLDADEVKNVAGKSFPFAAHPSFARLLIRQMEWVDALQKERKQVIKWLFPRADGRQLGQFHKEWTKACRAAGVPGRVVHDLRRTAVRNLVRAGERLRWPSPASRRETSSTATTLSPKPTSPRASATLPSGVRATESGPDFAQKWSHGGNPIT